jgi:Big-like domain-containing protein
MRCASAAQVAGVAVFLGWTAVSPPPAAAQLPLGSLVVNITSPANGSTVSGTIAVSATVTIIGGLTVRGVQFQLDGASLGAEDTSAPYSIPWNTLAASNGSHTLRAVARDLLGLRFNSELFTVTVSNDPTAPTVTLTSPTSGSTVSGAVTLSASASDNVGVAGVQFRLDGVPFGPEDTTAPYSATWNTTTSANGSHTVAAVARDAAGNTSSSSATVTVSNGPPPDTTPPTASITSPASGSTVSGTVTVSASASDNVGVVAVQFRLDGANLGAEDTTAPYSVTWDTRAAADGSHTLTAVARDQANNAGTSAAVTVTVSNPPASGGGDLFVAIVDGTVQWRSPDGSLRTVLDSPSDGQVSSVAFDAARNLYVPHWWGRSPGVPGNYMVRFDPAGNFLGPFGSGYNCSPSSVAFDALGNVYVGQAECTEDVLKFDAAGNLLGSFNVATGNRGADHIDLAPDGCTLFYASRTLDIFRYNVCTSTQLPRFNVQPLPGEAAFHLRILPDGGLVVADAQVIVRLDAVGNQIRLYSVPGEGNYWGGLDIVGDGTFWATNAVTSNVYKFDLETGAVLASFNTGTAAWTVAGIGVRP